ncbi:MAG: class I SAM-dependent methyltransferase [Lysobacterales bacterium]|jgi:ubiquinone/menaquinone biosynthesis C-methylase UbiE
MRKALDARLLKSVYDRVAGRYDLQHGLLTGGSDQRGRRLVVEATVRAGDKVLDCGAGTGSTALLAARAAAPDGRVTLLDFSRGMLARAAARAHRVVGPAAFEFCLGDMSDLPFADQSFDCALSTYSMCPLGDPARGALELYRVVRPGGRVGIAHSAEPRGNAVKWLADKVEDLAWRCPGLSLGCRSVSVLPVLQRAGCRVLLKKPIGVPLWPFLVLVVEKPAV